MFRQYLHELFTQSRRSSWTATNGIPGAALVGAAMIWRGVLQFIPGVGTLISSINWLASFILYAVIALAILFFIAPFKLWKEQCAKLHILESEKDIGATRIREIRAQEAHTAALQDQVEEMRRMRIQKEKENDPIRKVLFDKTYEQFKNTPPERRYINCQSDLS